MVKAMVDLTDEQKDECRKVVDSLMDYWWSKLEIKMESISYEEALKEIMEEIAND